MYVALLRQIQIPTIPYKTEVFDMVVPIATPLATPL